MTNRWIFRSFQQDARIRHLERYHHNLNQTEIPHNTRTRVPPSKDDLILIPDGPFLRKYLRFVEELVQQHVSFPQIKHLSLVLLESAAEVMDHRNSSPSISLSSGEFRTEAAASNERKRIVKLWQEFNNDAGHEGVIVFPFADLAYRCGGKDGDEDDFDIFHYERMSVKDRSRCALMRAAQLLTRKVGGNNVANIIVLSEDDLLLESNDSRADASVQTMNCDTLIAFLMNSCIDMNESEKSLMAEYWGSLQQRCQDEHMQRNTIARSVASDIETDTYGHFEYTPDDKLQEGISQKNLFRGALKVSNENPKEAYCTIKTSDGTSIKYYLNEIHGHFNRAIHEDSVIIQPLPREQWEQPVGKRRLVHIVSSDENEEPQSADEEDKRNVVPTARVVGLHNANRQRRKYVATMMPISGALRRDENNILVVPMDFKIPRIRIKTRIGHDKIENKRLLVEIDGWTLGSSGPTGHFVKILGEVGDLNTEIACLLREHCIDLSPFSANALACLPFVEESGWEIDSDEISRRRDLRKTCRIFSVDPNGCQDIDDAMHAKGEIIL